jgi:acetyl-CoA decarbonylase/synthase complex subunit gamma
VAVNPSGCCATPVSETATDKPPCCGPPATTRGGVIDETVPGFSGWLETGAGRTPQVASELRLADRVGAWKARWGIDRMHSIVPPGLYAIGAPGPDAPVVVTANYKMSYDLVRQSLSGRNVWLLVLETYGVNVWCAAGKGTFGTDELVERVEATGLAGVVNHRRLLLPILGAPGVAAHEVRRRTGFSVSYATMRAADLPAYLDNGMAATPAMREMTFTFRERLALVPVEIVLALKSTAIITLCLFIIGALSSGPKAGAAAALAYLGAMLTGVLVGPLLLPWLPGPSFAVKGALVGLGWSAAWYLLAGGSDWRVTTTVAAFLALPAVSAYYTLNFTGCTTFTSRTGVKKEMRAAIPAMGTALVVSALLLVAGRFL